MSEPKLSRLRFNLGFLLEALPGTSREVELDYPEIKISGDLTLAPLSALFRMARTAQGVYFDGSFQSQIMVECTRCLEAFPYPIDVELDDHFYFPPETAPDGEYTIDESGIVDLAPLVRELALLAVPINPICRINCQGLCLECGQNLNVRDCGCEPDLIDPRFAALQHLLDDEDV